MPAATAALPTGRPSTEGVDPGGIAALIDAVEAAPSVDPHSLMVLRHGRVVAAGWWAPYRPDRLHLLYSLSKSFTSTAAGLAVSAGLLDLDARVVDCFPRLRDEVTDPGTRSMLVRHLASMATGHTYDTWERAVALDPADPVRGFLRLPPDGTPGTTFAYNQSATFTLAAIVQQRTGGTLTDYLRPRLFTPLGIGATAWDRHPSGLEFGFSGLHATTDAIARLGQLYLQRGEWAGARLLPAAWVDEATRSHVDNSGESNPDWQQGYGFQFWRSRHGYRGDGAYGQFCLVLPEQDMVVASTAATADMQLVLDAVWEHLVPAVHGTPQPDPAGDAALQRRLDRLGLPVVPGAARPAGGPVAGLLTPTATEQRSLSAVEVQEHDGGVSLTLHEGDARLEVPVGTGEWAVAEPVGPAGPVPLAASGGWSGRTLRCDVLFLETPHRLELRCDTGAGTVTARWRSAPLHPAPLHLQRAPRD